MLFNDKKINFAGYTCVLEFTNYTNDNIAIVLLDSEDGLQVATATVNLPRIQNKFGHFFIKNWSENEGILQSLIDAEVLVPTGSVASTGHTHAVECVLTPEYYSKYFEKLNIKNK